MYKTTKYKKVAPDKRARLIIIRFCHFERSEKSRNGLRKTLGQAEREILRYAQDDKLAVTS
jgi:hypothetical protein